MAETIKKNVRDFTIGEVVDICRESSCKTCPFDCTSLCSFLNSYYYLNDEEEIEIPENHFLFSRGNAKPVISESPDSIKIDDAKDNTEYETIKCPACNAVVTQIKKPCTEVIKRGNPYKNDATAAYVTAVNILAVEYLVKGAIFPKKNYYEYMYKKYYTILINLKNEQLEDLYRILSFNRHISSLGAMITQKDYRDQVNDLLTFLDNVDKEKH